jgi:hypothetical protein
VRVTVTKDLDPRYKLASVGLGDSLHFSHGTSEDEAVGRLVDGLEKKGLGTWKIVGSGASGYEIEKA